MHRTQVLLTEEQIRALRIEAAHQGTSVATLIRQAVEARLSRHHAARRRALSAVGRFASGKHDIAEAHDRELEKIYGD
ncbi:CopG family transcriptional regulator [Candidatus Acetothermia bacterium]|nr:CopG family transcriptional regulator [Candidatus Acetothermia bacterium]MBI3661134.1 CopG family transcriptional regulator [Candidatus Acetothermia bacterium]